jgi:hypothetical protein
VSLSAAARRSKHKRVKARWFDQIARIEVETFPTREAALAAETAAIATEKPAFNKVGQPRESEADRTAALLVGPRRRPAWAWRDGKVVVTDMATAIGWLASFYPENQLADLAKRKWIRLENRQFELVPDVGPNGDPGEPPPAEDDEQEG